MGFHFSDNYEADFPATSYPNINRPTELPRQTVDAYLSKDEESITHHQHRHHRHKSHNRRQKTSGSSRPYHRHGKQEEQDKNLQKESEIQRASSTLNLDDIACPGCREAVVNEVLNQQRHVDFSKILTLSKNRKKSPSLLLSK